jgi:hypothetical protein
MSSWGRNVPSHFVLNHPVDIVPRSIPSSEATRHEYCGYISSVRSKVNQWSLKMLPSIGYQHIRLQPPMATYHSVWPPRRSVSKSARQSETGLLWVCLQWSLNGGPGNFANWRFRQVANFQLCHGTSLDGLVQGGQVAAHVTVLLYTRLLCVLLVHLIACDRGSRWAEKVVYWLILIVDLPL